MGTGRTFLLIRGGAGNSSLRGVFGSILNSNRRDWKTVPLVVAENITAGAGTAGAGASCTAWGADFRGTARGGFTGAGTASGATLVGGLSTSWVRRPPAA